MMLHLYNKKLCCTTIQINLQEDTKSRIKLHFYNWQAERLILKNYSSANVAQLYD